MNGALGKSLVNPWLATTVPFLLVLFVAVAATGDLAGRSWRAPLEGVAGVTLIARF